MGFVKKNTLNHFLNSVRLYNKKIDSSEITEVVGQIGVKIAQEEYAGGTTADENPTGQDIRAEIRDGGVDINAYGEKLAFSEFGTGIMGRGTYQGELPNASVKLEFESPKGVQQSTNGWQYNYRKEQGQTIKDFTGRPAKAQMFNTSQRLQSELSEEIRKFIKGD